MSLAMFTFLTQIKESCKLLVILGYTPVLVHQLLCIPCYRVHKVPLHKNLLYKLSKTLYIEMWLKELSQGPSHHVFMAYKW